MMCDIADSNRCMAAVSPRLDALATENPDGGVFLYVGDDDKIHGGVEPSYKQAERRFNALPEPWRRRGLLLQLLREDVALVL